MYKEIIDKIKPELEKVINFFDGEMRKIRTQRASPSLVEDMMVECFGDKFKLSQLASISIPEPRQILIQPWDKSYIEPIVNALSKSSQHFSPVVEKELIRINLPPLSEEFRKDLIRLISEKKEGAKQTIRRWREDAWKEIQEGFREGKVREDDKFRAKDELQDLIDEYSQKIEDMAENKKKEIVS